MEEEKGLTRRSFLAVTGLAVGGMAAASAAGCASIEASDETDEAKGSKLVEDQVFVNTCHGNCGGNCVLKATVREGKITSVFPQTFDRDHVGVEQGCARGMSTMLRVYGTHRLKYPLLQTGERGSDNWEQITWDEAFALIGEKLNAARDEYGPASVCIQGGAGNQYGILNGHTTQVVNWRPNFSVGVAISRFAQATGATMLGNGDDMAGLYVMMNILGMPFNSCIDLPNAKTIFVWGSNPAEAYWHAWNWMCKAREGGSKLVCVDPLYTSTAAHCDHVGAGARGHGHGPHRGHGQRDCGKRLAE